MARQKIREFDAKRIIHQALASSELVSSSFEAVLVTPDSDWNILTKEHPWLLEKRLVVKPDQLFGKRKQYDLVLVDADLGQVQSFIKEKADKEITIGKAMGKLTHFLVEAFVPHKDEYYLSIVSQRDGDVIYFSKKGGAGIEERWDSVNFLFVPTLKQLDSSSFLENNTSLKNLVIEEKISSNFLDNKLLNFIVVIFKAYKNLNFTYLEINPFTLDEQGQFQILDTVAQVDDFAQFEMAKSWGNLPFPKSFGWKSSLEEEYIADLDKDSGASLKLTVLNPQGLIWNIFSGGGASILIMDALAKYGKGSFVANYGEYSGNPTTEESYNYARTILDLMTREIDPQGKILLIGGAIANFTDVEKTFLGIVRALREYGQKLREGKVFICVRRGGPNYEKGLKLMAETGKELGLRMEVYGPETPLTFIAERAVGKIENMKKEDIRNIEDKP